MCEHVQGYNQLMALFLCCKCLNPLWIGVSTTYFCKRLCAWTLMAWLKCLFRVVKMFMGLQRFAQISTCVTVDPSANRLPASGYMTMSCLTAHGAAISAGKINPFCRRLRPPAGIFSSLVKFRDEASVYIFIDSIIAPAGNSCSPTTLNGMRHAFL